MASTITEPSFDPGALEYELPEARIAQAPLAERDGARLLCVERDGFGLRHGAVRDLPELLAPCLLVLNDTRVIPARLRGRKPSGGRFELLLVERLSAESERERWIVLGRELAVGAKLELGSGLSVNVLARHDAGYEVEFTAARGVAEALARSGEVPLPPYIRRAPDARDRERYQTVYAAHDGAVAAPTAGLHLSERLLERLALAGHELAFVTLHVGPGTFAPIAPELDFTAHTMHEERYLIPEATVEAVARAKQSGRRVLAIGTTSVRALEAAAGPDGALRAGAGATALFIYPPYRFRVVDALLTNFHLPRSTLLALCMAFAGVEPIRRAYAAAIAERYRFYSYGDAMLIGGAG